MKKLYDKNEILFAVLWIVGYCMILAPIRQNCGDESIPMLLVLAAIAAGSTAFILRHHLGEKYGLTVLPREPKRCLYFLPVWILVTGNLWGGIHPAYSGFSQVCAVCSMLLVGYAEEVIFRGFLFKALLPKDGTVLSVIISAATFGIGHIINLFTGQASLETVIQILFAIAWGFLFTMIFYKSGSLLPGIAAHGLIDVFSKFAQDHPTLGWVYTIAVIAVSALYCTYLARLPEQKAPHTA